MQKVSVNQLRPIFYKKSRVNGMFKPRWNELYTICEIMDIAGIIYDNKLEYMYLSEVVRKKIYALMNSELYDQGRVMVSVKDKGMPAKYGFANKKEYLLNFIDRQKMRINNIIDDHKTKQKAVTLKHPKMQLSFWPEGTDASRYLTS